MDTAEFAEQVARGGRGLSKAGIDMSTLVDPAHLAKMRRRVEWVKTVSPLRARLAITYGHRFPELWPEDCR